ncbi:hypothetical protein ACK8HX_02430 [Oryzobacter sp. R7]|uniref:hypothetical protein n=1 Tax=Oryzobacter faecalis TaxID=3388656 RepID=UPI00398CAA90
MAGDEPIDPLEDPLARERDRGLGDIPLRASAALAPFSETQQEAAANLLEKALLAIDDGDDARARRMVERAVALPYDEREQAHPAALVAEQAMYDAVTDAIEEDPDEDWLDAAVGTLTHGPEEGRLAMRDALLAVLQDYDLSEPERRRLRQAMARVPERSELHTLELTPAQLTDTVLGVLDGVLYFEDGYEELGRLH